MSAGSFGQYLWVTSWRQQKGCKGGSWHPNALTHSLLEDVSSGLDPSIRSSRRLSSFHTSGPWALLTASTGSAPDKVQPLAFWRHKTHTTWLYFYLYSTKDSLYMRRKYFYNPTIRIRLSFGSSSVMSPNKLKFDKISKELERVCPSSPLSYLLIPPTLSILLRYPPSPSLEDCAAYFLLEASFQHQRQLDELFDNGVPIWMLIYRLSYSILCPMNEAWVLTYSFLQWSFLKLHGYKAWDCEEKAGHLNSRIPDVAFPDSHFLFIVTLDIK